MANATRLLVYDPEQSTGREILSKLNGSEFIIRICEAHDKLPRMLREFLPQTLVVHVKPNDEPTLLLVQEMAKLQSLSPFSILGVLARESEATEVRAYEAGADSVLLAPLRARTLKHRIWAMNRWLMQETKAASLLTLGILTIDADQKIAYLQGHVLPLAKREFELLYTLAQIPGKIYSRVELLDQVAGDGHAKRRPVRIVDVHICNLRNKLPDQAIVTYRGKGYYLNKDTFLPAMATPLSELNKA